MGRGTGCRFTGVAALALCRIDNENNKRLASHVDLLSAAGFSAFPLHSVRMSVYVCNGAADGICICIFIHANRIKKHICEHSDFSGFVIDCLCRGGPGVYIVRGVVRDV